MKRGSSMSVRLAGAVAAAWLALGGALPASAQQAAPDNRAALDGVNEMRIAFDLTDGKPEALIAKLNVIDLTRRTLISEGVTPRFVITFRGDASFYTQADRARVRPEDREAADRVSAKLRELRAAPGVESLEQCSVPLMARSLDPANVIPEVKVVGNGWIALAAYQRKGYAYIAP